MTQFNRFEAAPSVDFNGGAEEFHGDAGLAQGQVTLRRSGAAPLTFVGSVLANAMSYRPGTPFWYEVNIFQMSGQGFVGDVRMFTKDENSGDLFTVFVGQSFDEVVSFLETYDAASDVSVEIDLDDAAVSLAEMTSQALNLRIKAEQARRQYRDLIGEMLFDLDQAATAGRIASAH